MHAGRVGVSLLNAAGLGGFVADSVEQYINVAARLAADEGQRDLVRGGMRDQLRASPLLDAAAMARRVESAYRQMWRDWCSVAGVK
jgi:predicted O-linked N-acetylglucosamine transferase (SPINDLY family)